MFEARLRPYGRQSAGVTQHQAGIRRRQAMMLVAGVVSSTASAQGGSSPWPLPLDWKADWPRTDFSRSTIDLREVRSGGPPRDGIPPIDTPMFMPARSVTGLDPDEPVLSFSVGDDARCYPLRVLIWHEIVNDVVGGRPVAVTYCPLCNTSIVFDRRLGDRSLDFGTTGKLRFSDLLMYDRQTESWWQQFTGEAVVGALAGARLSMLPSRLEEIGAFIARAPAGQVLVPRDPSVRPYGTNPYVGYDSAPRPFLYDGVMPPDGVAPMMRVVAVDDRAWTLPLLRARGTVADGDLVLRWRPGKRSALDAARISDGARVGAVEVLRDGQEAVHLVTFAFAFFAFNPNGVLYTDAGPVRL